VGKIKVDLHTFVLAIALSTPICGFRKSKPYLVRDPWPFTSSFSRLGEEQESKGEKGKQSDDQLLKDCHCDV
jgi:hypothetical protein